MKAAYIMLNKKISVALCTYNGAEFLPLQIKSIINQNLPPDEIVCCDDLSSDQTVGLIESFSSNVITPVRFYSNERNIGVIDNYSRAISSCKGDYIALCDQDDIWLPEKLAMTFNKMKEAEALYGSATPLLVHSDLSVIDASGRVIAPSFMKLRKLQPDPAEPLKVLLAQNFVTGCTVLVNRPLIEVALPIPESAVMHDWWLALVAAATGKIIYEPTATVLYRKHGKNVIGAKGFYGRENMNRLMKIKLLEKELAGTIKQVTALQGSLKMLGMAERYPYIDRYLEAISHGGVKAIKSSIETGIRKNGLARNLLFYFIMLKGGYRTN